MKKFFALLIATIAACALVSVFAGCADGGQNPAGGTSGGGNQTSTESGGTSGGGNQTSTESGGTSGGGNQTSTESGGASGGGNHSVKLSETEWVAAITEMYASTNFTYTLDTIKRSVDDESVFMTEEKVSRTDDVFTITKSYPDETPQGYSKTSMRFVIESDGIFLYTGDGVNYDSGVLLEGDALLAAKAVFAASYGETGVGNNTYIGQVDDEPVVGDLTKLYKAFVYDENKDIYTMEMVVDDSSTSGNITIKFENGKVVSYTAGTTVVAQAQYGFSTQTILTATFN